MLAYGPEDMIGMFGSEARIDRESIGSRLHGNSTHETGNMTLSDPPSIEDDVIEVLKRMSRQPIEPTASSDLVIDLGFDSLQILEVIAALEDRFDVSIPLNDVPSTRTVAQVVAQVTALVERRKDV